ncbi:MAG TPA: YheU family protein [Steroidobacteraceae bacterium]|nr:YheU family protein [Steroidobacteraceae bacterium]
MSEPAATLEQMIDEPTDRVSPPPGEPETEPVVVPHEELSPEALQGVIESFVLREGTDYGARELALEQKVANVMRELRRREARIVFDPATQTIDIVTVHGRR